MSASLFYRTGSSIARPSNNGSNPIRRHLGRAVNEGRYALHLRVEFKNIFNRQFVSLLSTASLGNLSTPVGLSARPQKNRLPLTQA